jgi:hypothetical protein
MNQKFKFGITTRRCTTNANSSKLSKMSNADEATHTSFTRLSRAL